MKNILLIDDDLNEHKLFGAYVDHLAAGKCQLHVATTLDEGVEKLSQMEFASVFLDNRLRPYADFRETLPAITEHSKDAKIYVISASINDECFKLAPKFPEITVIDKFVIREKLKEGLLD